jgi:ATPase subunit of ABC transporter with duplicated ATPase domains
MHSVLAQGRRLERERENLTEAPMSEWQIDLDLPEVSLPARKELIRMLSPGLFAPDGRRLTAPFELNVNAAEHIVITGRNGSGKSTLLKMLYAQLCARRDVNVFYMPQDYFEVLDEYDTPISFLAPTGEKDAVTRARTYLGSVRFTKDEAQSPVSKLSGGQKAKLFFVKMALDGPDVLLLDEPTRNFSPLSAPVIREIISSFGGCVIAVSHDRKFISEVGRRVVRMEELTGQSTDAP